MNNKNNIALTKKSIPPPHPPTEKKSLAAKGCIIQTNIIWEVDPSCDLDLKVNNPILFSCVPGVWCWLFPRVRGFLENVRQGISCLHFFFHVEIRSCTLIPLFRPGSVHNGSASWDDYGRVFPDELRVSLFPDRFPHCFSVLWLWEGGSVRMEEYGW